MRVTRAVICKAIKEKFDLTVEMSARDQDGSYVITNGTTRAVCKAEKLSDLSIDEWVDRFSEAYKTTPRRVWPVDIRKQCEKMGLIFEDASDYQHFRCVIKPPHKFTFCEDLHRLEISAERCSTVAADFWIDVNKRLDDLPQATRCTVRNCDHCKTPSTSRNEQPVLRPDPGNWQGVEIKRPARPTDEQIRISADNIKTLVVESGMTLQDAASSIGVKFRTMQDYVSYKSPSIAPYVVQFALECLVASGKG